MLTVPAQIFCAPTRAALIAAARFMPGVCAVLGSSWSPLMTRTPLCRQSTVPGAGAAWWWSCSLIALPPSADAGGTIDVPPREGKQAPVLRADANSSAPPFSRVRFRGPLLRQDREIAMAGPAEVEWRRLRADQLREMARADAIVILPVAVAGAARTASAGRGGQHAGRNGRGPRRAQDRRAGPAGGGAAGAVDRTVRASHELRRHRSRWTFRRSPRWSRACAARCCATGSSGSCC